MTTEDLALYVFWGLRLRGLDADNDYINPTVGQRGAMLRGHPPVAGGQQGSSARTVTARRLSGAASTGRGVASSATNARRAAGAATT